MKLTPYLSFAGRCEEAFRFYERCVGGRIERMVKFGDTPMAEQTPPEWRGKIAHARLAVGDQVLMGGDPPPAMYEQPKGFSVMLDADTPEDAEHIFNALAEDGTVRMPLGQTFWALRFGSLVDRFGIPWMVNCEVHLVVSRVFDAPRDLVWKAWVEPERMARWMGPRGFTGTIEKMEARPGGSYRFRLRSPDREEMWAQGVNREVVAPERLVYTWAWADAEGKPTGPETLVTVTFAEQNGKTLLTLHQSGFDSVASRDGHRGGWNSAFDCLEEYLAAA